MQKQFAGQQSSAGIRGALSKRRFSSPALILGVAATLAACGAAEHEETAHTHTPTPTVEVDLTLGQQGTCVAATDFDGDGIADKIVGAPRAMHEGKVGALLVYHAIKRGAFGFTPMMALTGGDSFGASCVALGDLDGDGRSELAVGAPHGDGDEYSLTGNVAVVHGGDGRVVTTLSAGVPAAKFGTQIAAGDLDSDGRLDIAVGAPFDTSSPELYQAGSVTVFFGPDFVRRHRIEATATTRGLGWAIAAGDVTGDGTADLVVGATGKIHVYAGGAHFAPATDAPLLTVTGIAGGLGTAVAITGDYSGDGVPDLGLGAPKASVGKDRDVGAMFVVAGGGTADSVDLDVTPPSPRLIATVQGAALFDRFGSSLASVDDIDGDGKPELVAGAPLADAVATNALAGRVYLFKSAMPLSLLHATAFDGADRSGRFGAALAQAAKGLLLVGAPRCAADTGAVALFDLTSGQPVKAGSSGGSTGQSGCHCDETGECHC